MAGNKKKAAKTGSAPMGDNLNDIKSAIYKEFGVNSLAELKKDGNFSMATDGMDFDSKQAESWKQVYRKFIGTLPSERNQSGYGTINGVNVFNYFKPWQVFGLDSKTATKADIKNAYRTLSKKYHPDNKETGDAKIFEQINIMYKSITAGS